MYSIIVFTKEELENRFKELEEKHGITREIFFSYLHFPDNFNVEKINPKYLKVGTYTKILETLFDAEKNPEKYKISTKNSSENIKSKTLEKENVENFTENIVTSIPRTEKQNNNVVDKKTEKEKKIELQQIISKAPKYSEDFKFFVGSFGNPESIETEEKIEERNNTIAEQKTEPISNISHLIPEKTKAILQNITNEEISTVRLFSKKILQIQTKIEKHKKAKYSLEDIRNAYNSFVKQLEGKYQKNFKDYYITKNIRDDETLEYHFPDADGTKKIINLFGGMLIYQKSISGENISTVPIQTEKIIPKIEGKKVAEIGKNSGFQNFQFIKKDKNKAKNSQLPKIISTKTGQKIIIRGNIEQNKEGEQQKEKILPKSNFSYIRECTEMLKNNIKNGANQVEIENIINIFHERLRDIEQKNNIYLGNYYIEKDTFNPITKKLDFPKTKSIISKIYTCAGHIYVNKI